MNDLVDLVLSQWEQECPNLDISPMSVLSRVFRFHAFAARDVGQAFKRHHLHQGEFDVLATLYRTGAPYAMNPQKLVAALLLTSGAMTNRLDRLEQAGLLARTPNPDDRRGVIVALTAEGLRVIKQVLKDYLRELESLLAPLNATERRQMAGLLKKLLIPHDRETSGGIAA
ncbi:MarR family winged helix-turn-helix transcriptional regulator [Achromobacter dolens]|uniref:MarR family winged helix-turn-helix transcriptional regulator n=1 Tax=Achromobacter dolens TaxID=1287738 RepID=UPI0006C4E01E|nr:MarR family transcriptional regulator [Achromobacter dolens]CUJ56831.1 Multiple antibiotic resistance protein marR [Achromobacter dolens]